MKKLFVFMIAPLIMAASCKKDSTEGDGVSKDSIVGKWELVSQTVTIPGEGEHTANVPADAPPSYWTFTSDGKVNVDGSYDFDTDKWSDTKGEVTYTLSGKHLTLNGDESAVFEAKVLTTDRLVLVFAKDGGSIGLSFKKVR